MFPASWKATVAACLATCLVTSVFWQIRGSQVQSARQYKAGYAARAEQEHYVIESQHLEIRWLEKAVAELRAEVEQLKSALCSAEQNHPPSN